MGLSNSINRAGEYYRRHGFKATITRAGLALKHELFAGRMVVFYCDLATQTTGPVGIPRSLRVVRLKNSAELGAQDLQKITSFWNPKLARQNIRERFERGASLWLIKSGDDLAGYGWTLQGCTIEPYFFPLGQDDVHLFDFHVFPQYRGQGINPHLVTHILRNVSTIGGGRAFIEAAEWNVAQLSSLRKTPFRRLGFGRTFTIFGLRYTRWIEDQTVEYVHKAREGREKARAIARPHEQ